ncbi:MULTISPECIES: hypothetical protein [Streptomyces]|uniref:Uncharacterized protein n=1 Tax=Streptomyces maoxianensis TaxID=1459942 RepID=A0ABV9G035_9ACTN|nr:hypothetical protein [Streptomyces sp. ISL-1]
MSARTVLVAALITGFVLGIAGTRTDHSTPPRETGPIAEAGR